MTTEVEDKTTEQTTQQTVKRKERKLNWLQEAFVRHYVANRGNGTLACRKAGYRGSDKVLGITAVRLLGNDRIIAKINKEKAELSETTGIDAKWVINKLTQLYRDSVAAHDRTNASRALDMLGKVTGVFEADNRQRGGLQLWIE